MLQEWIKANNMTVIGLANELALSRQNVYHNIKQGTVSEDFKNRLALKGYNVFGITDSKNINVSETIPQHKRYIGLTSDRPKLTNHEGIPMLPTDENTFDPESDLPVPVYRLQDPELAGAQFGIILRGASMYPKYMPGSRIAVKAADVEEIVFSHVYLIITAGGFRTVMYIEPDPQGRPDWVLLRPHNPDMHPTPLPRAKLKHVYHVLGSVQFE